MAQYALRIPNPRPYFAELPYYLWGRVNYDSEGNCENPLDREWTWMELTHRETGEVLDVFTSDSSTWCVTGPDPAAARLAYFLCFRCHGESTGATRPDVNLGEWDHEEAAQRASRVAEEFENEVLAPFAVGHVFWGSWKWIGWFGTDFTWIGRWIMDAVIRSDPRAVYFCIEWLREGTCAETQSAALRYALHRFTGVSFPTDEEWIRWYDADGKKQYPEPDTAAWYEDLKAIHGE